ncbi:DUF3794 domain-containing protein [Clostridium weizhouense]|uniref:DUF3794 domain-containing protein n=1 Tax=Clostridium weizhouense TaxID=2859781 RepID=A0ABS7ALH5_9CLOT|nr:DUF3794 domain-containing protein [Clostridium weizhouense]MBW6409256.1 DUF3794 domain-containing protein [Clostridium weizhouense]
MASVIRGLIEYNGIDNCTKNNMKNFRQINYESTFCVPCQKPDIEQIVKVYADTDIVKYEIIKTPIGISLEGQKVTGFKLLVCGDINYKIQYVADEPTQSVHTFHQSIPFCGYIVLPEKFNPGSYINPSALIEDISVEQMDSRCVYSNITLLLVTDISC